MVMAIVIVILSWENHLLSIYLYIYMYYNGDILEISWYINGILMELYRNIPRPSKYHQQNGKDRRNAHHLTHSLHGVVRGDLGVRVSHHVPHCMLLLLLLIMMMVMLMVMLMVMMMMMMMIPSNSSRRGANGGS